MLRLFVDRPLDGAASFELPPAAARHVQVRRLQPRDALVLFDGRGGEWMAQVVAMGRQSVSVRVSDFVAVDRELPRAVTLAVGMPANERMDMLVEKATELGVHAVQPLHCARSVLRLDEARARRRQAHWQALAVSAAEQSGRTRLPQVMLPMNLVQWLAALPDVAQRWVLTPGATQPRHCADATGPLLVLSGPEGGLAPEERTAAGAAGFAAIGLGPRVLRADTAPLALLAWLGVG